MNHRRINQKLDGSATATIMRKDLRLPPRPAKPAPNGEQQAQVDYAERDY